MVVQIGGHGRPNAGVIMIAWSYSRLMDYEKCPQLFKFKVIDKLKEPSNAAMERGSMIHLLAETWLKAKTLKKVPTELKRVAPMLKTLKRLNAEAEAQWTLRPNFEGSTGWFAKDAWLRVKVDAQAMVTYQALKGVEELVIPPPQQPDAVSANGLWVVDWKTGRFRPETATRQLELYTLTALVMFPKVDFVVASLGYIDEGRPVHTLAQDRAVLTSLKRRWADNVAKLQKDTKFKATPGAPCNWCHFSKLKGGPCLAG